MKNKGFTLIELLAVIVLLGIILAIAVPSVNGVIENSRKKAFEVAANDIVRSAKLYYATESGINSSITSDYTFSFADGKKGETDTGEKLALTGSFPTDGRVVLYTDGRVDLNVCNSAYCACKGAGTDVLFIVTKTTEICGTNDDGTTADNPITSAQVSLLQAQIDDMVDDIDGLKDDIDDLQSDNATLKTDNTNLKSDVSTLQTNVNNLQTNFLGKTYPIGSIYMSISNTNPGTIFGGTWVAWGTGKVPVGVDTNQTEFNTVEKAGGNKTITLTAMQIPPIPIRAMTAGGTSYNGDLMNLGTGGSLGGWGLSIASTNQGVGRPYADAAFDNNINRVPDAVTILSPYITVYMWKRTS